MYNDVIFEMPEEHATRETKWCAQLQTNRGVVCKVAYGPTKQYAKDRLNSIKNTSKTLWTQQ